MFYGDVFVVCVTEFHRPPLFFFQSLFVYWLSWFRPFAMAENLLVDSGFKGMSCSKPVNPFKVGNHLHQGLFQGLTHQWMWRVQVCDFNQRARLHRRRWIREYMVAVQVTDFTPKTRSHRRVHRILTPLICLHTAGS